jgi:phosphohistidine phosphatase
LQAIIASPYVRAQQTAALVHDTLGFAEPCAPCPG